MDADTPAQLSAFPQEVHPNLWPETEAHDKRIHAGFLMRCIVSFSLSVLNQRDFSQMFSYDAKGS